MRYRLVAMVATATLLIASCSSSDGGEDVVDTDSDPATTQATSPTASTEPPGSASDEALFAQKVATIEAMVEARNSGDYEAWRSYFPAEQPVIWANTVESESELDWQRSYMAANEMWTITAPCQSRGSAVSCPMTLVHDFFAPAGLFFRTTVDFEFNDNGEIAYLGTGSWEIAGDWGEYTEAFDTWLLEAHPDVHASFGPRVEGENGLPNADDMPKALEYVDEFIGQSDIYPLGAVRVANDYFDAFNAGDDEAAAALLTSEVAATDTWGSINVVGELASFTAQGAQYRSVACAVSPQQPADGTSVTCDHETLDALTRAVDAVPIPTTTTFTVTPSGIAELHFGYGSPDFTHVGFQFQRWLADNRPDVGCLAWYGGDESCPELETLEEQREEGRLVAQYAQEWAAYLEENGCGYLDGC
ncbi:MAG: hypothetical protein WBM90_12080 [Acidimicrobiia bacterium]